jgi:threonine aldolase
MAKKIAAMWTEMGGKLDQPTETNMVWFNLEDLHLTGDEFAAIGKKHGLRFLAGRLVVHYQIGDEAVERLEGVMKEAIGRKHANGNGTTHKKRKVGEKAYGT